MKACIVALFTSLLLTPLVLPSPVEITEQYEDDRAADEVQSGASASERTGYPQLFTKKTTRLLSEALHMLNRVKDVKERRWLESFVHRLGNLASELDRKATSKVSSNGTTKDLVAFSESLADNTKQLKEFAVHGAKEAEKVGDLNKEVSVGVALKSSEQRVRDELESQLRSQPSSDGLLLLQQQQKKPREDEQWIKESLKSNKTPKGDDEKADHREAKLKQEKVKEAEKKKILKEIYALSQKLKELGGETKSVLDVIKRSKSGGVQIGTGHHFWDQVHKNAASKRKSTSDESSTSAPSNSQLREADVVVPATKTTVSLVDATNSKESRQQSEEEDSDESVADSAAEDNSDDLEKQLQDEKLILDTDKSSSSSSSPRYQPHHHE